MQDWKNDRPNSIAGKRQNREKSRLVEELTLKLILLLLNVNIMDVLIPLCLLLEIKLTKLWFCILFNHIARHSSCTDVKFGH